MKNKIILNDKFRSRLKNAIHVLANQIADEEFADLCKFLQITSSDGAVVYSADPFITVLNSVIDGFLPENILISSSLNYDMTIFGEPYSIVRFIREKMPNVLIDDLSEYQPASPSLNAIIKVTAMALILSKELSFGFKLVPATTNQVIDATMAFNEEGNISAPIGNYENTTVRLVKSDREYVIPKDSLQFTISGDQIRLTSRPFNGYHIVDHFLGLDYDCVPVSDYLLKLPDGLISEASWGRIFFINDHPMTKISHEIKYHTSNDNSVNIVKSNGDIVLHDQFSYFDRVISQSSTTFFLTLDHDDRFVTLRSFLDGIKETDNYDNSDFRDKLFLNLLDLPANALTQSLLISSTRILATELYNFQYDNLGQLLQLVMQYHHSFYPSDKYLRFIVYFRGKFVMLSLDLTKANDVCFGMFYQKYRSLILEPNNVDRDIVCTITRHNKQMIISDNALYIMQSNQLMTSLLREFIRSSLAINLPEGSLVKQRHATKDILDLNNDIIADNISYIMQLQSGEGVNDIVLNALLSKHESIPTDILQRVDQYIDNGASDANALLDITTSFKELDNFDEIYDELIDDRINEVLTNNERLFQHNISIELLRHLDYLKNTNSIDFIKLRQILRGDISNQLLSQVQSRKIADEIMTGIEETIIQVEKTGDKTDFEDVFLLNHYGSTIRINSDVQDTDIEFVNRLETNFTSDNVSDTSLFLRKLIYVPARLTLTIISKSISKVAPIIGEAILKVTSVSLNSLKAILSGLGIIIKNIIDRSMFRGPNFSIRRRGYPVFDVPVINIITTDHKWLVIYNSFKNANSVSHAANSWYVKHLGIISLYPIIHHNESAMLVQFYAEINSKDLIHDNQLVDALFDSINRIMNIPESNFTAMFGDMIPSNPLIPKITVTYPGEYFPQQESNVAMHQFYNYINSPYFFRSALQDVVIRNLNTLTLSTLGITAGIGLIAATKGMLAGIGAGVIAYSSFNFAKSAYTIVQALRSENVPRVLDDAITTNQLVHLLSNTQQNILVEKLGEILIDNNYNIIIGLIPTVDINGEVYKTCKVNAISDLRVEGEYILANFAVQIPFIATALGIGMLSKNMYMRKLMRMNEADIWAHKWAEPNLDDGSPNPDYEIQRKRDLKFMRRYNRRATRLSRYFDQPEVILPIDNEDLKSLIIENRRILR